MSDDGPLAPVVSAVCDGTPVDWAAAREAAQSESDRALLRHLEAIVSSVPRREAPPGPAGWRWSTPGALRLCGSVILLLAAVKVFLAFAVVLASSVTDGLRASSSWMRLGALVLFGVAGGALIWGGGRDPRVRRLGALFVLIASSYSDTAAVRQWVERSGSWPLAALQGFATDAFLAFSLWMFVAVFPTPARRRTDRFFGHGMAGLSLVAGLVLAAANLARHGPASWPLPPSVFLMLGAVDRNLPGDSYYWAVLFGLAALALPYLLWRSRFDTLDNRRRVAFFAGSLAIGTAPMLVAVILSPFLPFFDSPEHRQRIGIVLNAALLLVVPATAYSVFVHRVLDVGVVVKRTMQYRIARYIVWGVTAAPVAALVIYVYGRRTMPVAELFDRLDTLVLVPAVAAGLAAVFARQKLLAALDRAFLRESINHVEVIAAFEQRLREAASSHAIGTIVAEDIDRAVHPRSIAVLLPDRSARRLVPLDGRIQPLDLDSSLGALVESARQEIQIGRASSPVWDLLPPEDRAWLASGGFQLLVPLVTRAGRLAGSVVLGDKRSEMPYSREERLLLRVMAAEAAVTLENCRLRRLPAAAGASLSGTAVPIEEPAAQCRACRLISPASTRVCRCGAQTEDAVLPVSVLSKFRLERLLGSGGMGQVYLALDLSLDRRVAIKTLSRLTPEKARQIDSEARAMARVQHPNLVLIYGVEKWDEYPLLVVEYLEGGTLADRLRLGRLTPGEAMALGVVLGDALDRIHASGMLHRDIKPSNIGYAADGVPKLLDFGLASLVGRSEHAAYARQQPDGTAAEFIGSAAVTSTHHFAGTLPYLSPEALAGHDPDVSFDLWSLSLVLFQAIAGVNPFTADDPARTAASIRMMRLPDLQDYAPECPAAIARFFDGALGRSRDTRPRTAAALRNQCRALMAAPRA